MKSRIKVNYPSLLLSLTDGTREPVTPHISETRIEQRRCTALVRPELVPGEFSGETTGNIVTYCSRCVGWSRW